jgi:hypothetical protein
LKKEAAPEYRYNGQRYSSILQARRRREENLHLYEEVYHFHPVKFEQSEYAYFSSNESGNEKIMKTFVGQNHERTHNVCLEDLTAIQENATYVELPEIDTVYLEPLSFSSKDPTPLYAQSKKRETQCRANKVPRENVQDFEMLNITRLSPGNVAVHL